MSKDLPPTAEEYANKLERNVEVRRGQKAMGFIGGAAIATGMTAGAGGMLAAITERAPVNGSIKDFASGVLNAAKAHKGIALAITATSVAVGSVFYFLHRHQARNKNDKEIGQSFRALRSMADEGNPKAQEVFGRWSGKVVAEKNSSSEVQR